MYIAEVRDGSPGSDGRFSTVSVARAPFGTGSRMRTPTGEAHLMTSRPHRSRAGILVVLFALVVGGFSTITATAPAFAADPAPLPTDVDIIGEPCPEGDDGVTVVIDFTFLTDSEGVPLDEVRVACAEGPQTDGFAALEAAGFTVEHHPQFSGFLCLIEGYPLPAQSDCMWMGYWSYWHAEDGWGDDWEYSNWGAGNRTPPPGSVEGWSFWNLADPPPDPENNVWAYPPRVAPNQLPLLLETEPPTSTYSDAVDLTVEWLERELADNGGVMPGFSPGSADLGLTIDAVYALIAAGELTSPTVTNTMNEVEARFNSYVTWDDFGDFPGVRVAGALGKVTLAAGMYGADVNDFGGWDLEAALRSLMQGPEGAQPGRFSDRNPHFPNDNSNMFGQVLSMLALDRTPGGIPELAGQFLLSQQCPSGGFRLFFPPGSFCGPGDPADTDGTAMALQALLELPPTPEVEAAIDAALAWFESIQLEGGAWGGTGPTAAANSNSTGLIAQALRGAGATTLADEGADYILTLQLTGANAAGTPAADEIGVIAYNAAARDSAIAGGIPAMQRDQWRRATPQAVLALGLPTFGEMGSHTEPTTVTYTARFDTEQRCQAIVDFAAGLGLTPAEMIKVGVDGLRGTAEANPGTSYTELTGNAGGGPGVSPENAVCEFEVTWDAAEALDIESAAAWWGGSADQLHEGGGWLVVVLIYRAIIGLD